MRKISFTISILLALIVTVFFAGDLFSNNVEDPIEEIQRNWKQQLADLTGYELIEDPVEEEQEESVPV